MLNAAQCLLKVDSDEDVAGLAEAPSDAKVFQLINSASIQASSLSVAQFKKILLNDIKVASANDPNLNDLKLALKKLVGLASSSELTKYNNQIVSYMAEQLIHKAALNGHLKFACEIMRKKSSELLEESMDSKVGLGKWKRVVILRKLSFTKSSLRHWWMIFRQNQSNFIHLENFV